MSIPIDGAAMFPTPDRKGNVPVQSFSIPFDGAPMIVGADRKGRAVVAPTGIPIDDSPLIGVADKDSVGVGVTFGAPAVEHSIALNVPAPNGQADIVIDDWSCGRLSDNFNRANGNPLSLPNFKWYDLTGPPNPASAQILNNELAGLWAAVPQGGTAWWFGDTLSTPFRIKGTINARNIVYGVGNTWGIADWRIGTRLVGGLSQGELRIYKLADPDLKAYVQIVARFAGGTSTSGIVSFPNLAAVLGNDLTVTVSDTKTKVEFLTLTVTES